MHESVHDTDADYPSYQYTPPVAAAPTVKEAPKVATAPTRTLSCAVAAAPKLVEDRLTKEELSSVSSEKELMALVAKHIKSLEASIEAYNKAIDSHNRQLLRCQPN